MRSYWTAGLVLALAGVAIAGYLSVTHLIGSDIACAGGSGCEDVQASRFGYLLGIPLPYLGLGFYLAVAALMVAGRSRPAQQDLVLPPLLILTLAGALFSGYLTGVQAAVLGTFCVWCLASAAVETGLLALTGVLFYARAHGAS